MIRTNFSSLQMVVDKLQLGTRWRSVRHLRGTQLYWRARYLAERRHPITAAAAARWFWKQSGCPAIASDFPDIPVFHLPGPRGTLATESIQNGVWSHLNTERELGRQETDWRLGPIEDGRLWTVTLHYHAWAFALAEAAAVGDQQAASLFQHCINDWIVRCALDVAGARNLAWNAYAIATRVTWWIRSYRTLPPEFWSGRGEFHGVFLASLWQQAAYLADHLEWDLRGNHLLRDAVGLAWAGRFFDHPQASQWLATASRIARVQVAEQVLTDGGHFERSPMYHLHVMEDILSLAILAKDDAARTELRNVWQRMAEIVPWLCHPDGQIACFNDAACHATCDPQAMLNLRKFLGTAVNADPARGGRYFADLGLVAWQGEPWTVFFDVGPIGPDYQPGHAHADTLSVECSYGNERLIVDPGTYSYDRDDRRNYDRSTAAHNTVAIDGQNSSEVWHIFRVGRRAYPRNVEVVLGSEGFRASASHDGYDQLPGRPRHWRQVELTARRPLQIIDRLTGAGEHQAEGGFLLAPHWHIEMTPDGCLVSRNGTQLRIQIASEAAIVLQIEQRPYHVEFGREILANRISWRYSGIFPLEVTTTIAPA